MPNAATHFKNEMLHLVARRPRFPLYSTVSYTLWSNDGIERLGKELLCIFRLMAFDLQMTNEKWPDLFSLVQSAMNNAPSPQRTSVRPIKAMTGIPVTAPIERFYHVQTTASVAIANLNYEHVLNREEICQLIGDLHLIVQDAHQTNSR